MKKRIVIVFMMLITFAGVVTLYAKANKEREVQSVEQESTGFLSNLKELKQMSDMMDLILELHVGEKEVSKEELLKGAIEGMVNSLDDPHTSYFTKAELESFNEDTKGEYAGVGMVVSKRDNILTVVSPIEDTPAFRAGMKPKDKIIEIEGESTLDLTLTECVDRLKGKPGTEVKITVFREGKEDTFPVTLKRAIIKLKYVKYKMLDDKIGYLRLTQFGSNVGKDIRKAVDDLRSQGMNALVFDLRNNPGGLLNESIAVASVFVEESPIVTVRYKGGRDEEVYDALGGAYTDFPLVVLINEGSASASEIVSGAIKDHKRGLLLGEKSFGKGSVQNIIPLQDGGLKLTIAKYYTPADISIHKIGIEPDILVEEEEDFAFFEGFVTNVVEVEEEKEETKIEEKSSEENDKEKDEMENKESEEKEKVDKQLNQAINVLKGIILYNKTK